MDIELLKTFIEVARLRHFGHAADRVFITQSAVSARIKLLEQTLGTQLLTRDRNNIQLTEAGQRLLKSAATIVNQWERVRSDILLAAEHGGPIISLGYINDLWPIFVRSWIQSLRQQMTDTVFKLHGLNAQTLADTLAAGELDFALMFEPPDSPSIATRELFQIPLVLVSDKSVPLSESMNDHIQVDWGSAFSALYDEYFEGTDACAIHYNNGVQALDHLLLEGGTAYLPTPVVQPYLASNRLFIVDSAPKFDRLVYFACRQGLAQTDRITALMESAVNWWKVINTAGTVSIKGGNDQPELAVAAE